jgi:outer membrane immunogenic protein
MYSPAPVATWDGAYVGVQGGVVRRDSRLSFSPDGDRVGNLAGDQTGGMAGALLGYNWQHGSFVYGFEGDWSWIGAKAGDQANSTLNSDSYDVNWIATLRARAGLAMDSTLFYVTGGAAFGHLKDNFAFLDPVGATRISYTKEGTKSGWTAGAGVEHMFAPQWTARADFRYVDLGKATVACAPGTSICDGFSTQGAFSNSLWMGLVGLNYRFGGRATDWSQARAYTPRLAASWAGAYLGLQGGVARHDAYFNDRSAFVFFNSGLDSEKKTGGAVGGLVGYNWQQGSFVYGLEGDWN